MMNKLFSKNYWFAIIIAMVLSVVLVATPAYAALRDNVVVNYHNDEGSGNTIHDSLNLRNVTVAVTTWGTGLLGGAWNPQASGDTRVNTGLNLNGQSDSTIAFWIKHTSSPPQYQYLIRSSASDNPSTNGEFRAFVDTCGVTWDTYSNIRRTTCDNQVMNAGTWYNYVVVRTASQLRVYRNNVNIFNQTQSGYSHPNQNVILFGNDGTNNNVRNALIDEITIWNRTLSDAEIAQYYNGGTGKAYDFVSPENTVTVQLINAVNGSSWPTVTFGNVTGLLTFTYFNITPTGFCVSYAGNGTGTNCTAGNGVSTYFNVTNTTSITGVQTVASATYAAIVSINVTQLLTGNQIQTFNATNYAESNQTTSGGLIIKANTGSQNIKIDVPGNFSQNITCNVPAALATVSCQATGVHDTIINVTVLYGGSPVTNFSANITNHTLGAIFSGNTTTGNVTVRALRNYAYYAYVDPEPYTFANATIIPNTSLTTYQFTVYQAQTLNITVYSEVTEQRFNTTVNLELISTLQASNYTSTNGSFYFSLLIPTNYTLRYSAPDYPERDYYQQVARGSYNDLSLYLIDFNNSGTVIATVEDMGGEPVEGATVKLLRYYTTCNCYEVVEMADTSASGQAYLNAEYYEGHYKWSVDYEGINRFLSTTPENLIPEDGASLVTKSFTINLGEDYYSPDTAMSGIGVTCAYNEATGGLSFSWSDPGGYVTSGCLRAEYLDGVHYEVYGYDCVLADTGSVVLALNHTNETRYLYEASLTIDGVAYPVQNCAGWIEPDGQNHFGTAFGAFLAAAIIITLVMIFSYSAIAVLAISVAGIILVSALGLMTFSTTFIGGIVVLVMGLGVYLMRS